MSQYKHRRGLSTTEPRWLDTCTTFFASVFVLLCLIVCLPAVKTRDGVKMMIFLPAFCIRPRCPAGGGPDTIFFQLVERNFLKLSFHPSPLPHDAVSPRWPSGKASASRAEDLWFESRRDFWGVESYQ